MSDELSQARRLATLLGVDTALEATLVAATLSMAGADEDRPRRMRQAWDSERDNFMESVARLYVSVYSAEDINALVAFLASPSGEAMRRAQPVIEQGMRALTTSFLERAARQAP